MINANHEELTCDALGVMERTRDPRLREIMVSLVRHLHAFVRDVRLTEPEFRKPVIPALHWEDCPPCLE